MAINFAALQGFVPITDCLTPAQFSALASRASRKHSFAVVCLALANPIPWTPGHIASLIVPQGSIWVGGDNTVQATNGSSLGIPLIAGQPMIFGLEEGSSATYIICLAPPIYVSCLELLP